MPDAEPFLNLDGLGIRHVDVDCEDCLQTVLTAAICFFLPNHFSTLMVLASGMYMSTARCLNSLVRVPLAPFTVTALAFTEASIPSGTSISSKELISFMTSLVEVNQAIKAWSLVRVPLA